MWMHNQQPESSDASYQRNNQINSTNCFQNFDQFNQIYNKPVEDLKQTLKRIPNTTEFRSDLVKLLATAANLLFIYDTTFDNSTELEECIKEHTLSYNTDVHLERICPNLSKEENSLIKSRTISTSTTMIPIKLDKCSMTDKLDKCCMTEILQENYNIPYEGRYQNAVYQKQFVAEETQTRSQTFPRLRTAFEKRLAEVSNTLKNCSLPEWQTIDTISAPPPTRLSAGEDNDNDIFNNSIEDERQEKNDQMDITYYKPACTCRTHTKKTSRKQSKLPNPPNTPLEMTYRMTDTTVPIRTTDGRLMELGEVVTPSVIEDKLHGRPTLTFPVRRKERLIQTTSLLPDKTEETDEADDCQMPSSITMSSKPSRSSKQNL